MIIDYINLFNVPSECIEGGKIPKKLFYEEYNMSSSDKEIFTRDIDKILLEYMFSEDRINIASYKNDEIECEEIAVIRVLLEDGKKYKRICEIIQRAIPYSIIIICEHNDNILFNVANKRINKNDEEKNTVEEMLFTDWISLNVQSNNVKLFLSGLNVRECSYINLYKFYNSFVDKVKLFNASRYTSIEDLDGLDVNEVKDITDNIEKLGLDITILRNNLKKETQFNKKIEINIKIKKMQEQQNKLISKLKGES